MSVPVVNLSCESLRWQLEVESCEVLEHQRDATETTVTGTDDSADWAYGNSYYLREEYLDRLQNAHRQREPGRGKLSTDQDNSSRSGNPTAGNAEGGVDLYLPSELPQPAFFAYGNDFPSVKTLDAASERTLEGPTTSTEWLHTGGGDSDIVLPVVSSTCTLAQAATAGSSLLGELKRLMDRERINKDTMDTSKSNLTQLLRKDDIGRDAEVKTEDHLMNDISAGGVSSVMMNENDLQGVFDHEGKEVLLRDIRLEKRRAGALTAVVSSASLSPHPTSSATARAASPDRAALRMGDCDGQQRRKAAKLEGMLTQRRQMVGVSGTEEDDTRRAHIRHQQQALPIFHCRDELLSCIGENAVTIVVGETGSGKTTQLVQYLYQRGYTRSKKRIGCTQPRRLAAIGVARRVSDEMNCVLGSTVGYSIHLDDMTTADTEIKFMTDGVLLREVVNDPDLEQYSVIVLDEAHERSVDTDVLMGVLKLAIRRRGDLKLIVTSATMDIRAFSRFFGNAPCYEVPGQTYDVQIRYTPDPVSDYVAEAVFRVCQLHLQMPLKGKHDVLVFMTGRDDVFGTCELIKRRLQELDAEQLKTLIIIPCMSEMPGVTSVGGSDPHIVGLLDETPDGMRKCVVATNVAETSLTIDGVRYVVDCGFMKTNVFRPKIGMNTLQRYPVSQAQAGQRKGRAGRTTEGLCFRLYTEEQFEQEMLVSSVPEIQRSSIDNVVLLLKSIGVNRLVDFDFMDPPPVANVRNSMWHLWVLGLLDEHGAITPDGRRALDFPMAPSLAKLLVESTQQGCAVEVVRIVSLITADPKKLFELPKGKEQKARQHHGRFYANDSDHLTLLNVFTQYMDNGRSSQWAVDHFLHAPTLQRAYSVLEQLMERLRRLRLPIASCGLGNMDKVRYCLAKAFCLQSAKRSTTVWNEYRPLLHAGVVCHLHPSSALCGRIESPAYVVYNDLLYMTREYLVLVTAVEPEWLAEGSHGLFKIQYRKHQGARAASTVSGVQDTEAVKLSAANGSSTASAVAVTGASTQPAPRVSSMSKEAPMQPPAAKLKFGMMASKRRQNV